MEDVYYAFNPWWENRTFDSGITRQEYLEKIGKIFTRRQIVVIVGSRRVGKTTFLKQVIKNCLDKKISANNILYLALDNPKFSRITLSEHLKMFRKIFMHPRSEKLYLFFDEVQESSNWEAELKAIYDLENVKIICTGSTSGLLKKQGGRLTGRQIVTKIYPLTFKEYLTFKKNIPSKSEGYKYEKLFENYLEVGGYPKNVLESSEEYMNNLIEDIIARDIIRLHRLNRPDLLKDLLIILASSMGSRISFNRIAKLLGITVDTVKEYVGYFEEAFLIKPLLKWSQSYADKIYAQKKIYFYDTGLKTTLTGKADLGAKTENVVFLHLVKNNPNIGYYAESEREIDFVCGSFKLPTATEVKYESKFDWKDKKFMGVRLFIRRYPSVREVTIVSKNVMQTLKDGKLKISVVPAWEYVLLS
jgi:hypothetical protein